MQSRKPKLSVTTKPLTVLGGISAEHFFREYWQKKPLLIRQAFQDFSCPVDANELAGLAMEASVESRLILENGASQAWQLRHGPFNEQDFAELPDSHWTLLIQQLDAWVPEINQLKAAFDFIPNWRIDDIMASYAPIGGSVGPHFDHYDVFLLQAQGHRQWQLGQVCNQHGACLPDCDLKILEDFDSQQQWLLAPGDMLYLPPKLAHFGVATDDCITLSVGFRAPSHQQLISEYADFLLAALHQDTLYQDPNITPQACAGEVSADALDAIQQLLQQHIGDRKLFETWFGQFITAPKNTASLGLEATDFSLRDLQELIEQDVELLRNEGSRLVYIESKAAITVFADGADFTLKHSNLAAIQHLCGHEPLFCQQFLSGPDKSELSKLILKLIQQGSLYF